MEILQKTGGDFTNCFRLLSKVVQSSDEDVEEIINLLAGQTNTPKQMAIAFKPRMNPTQLTMLQNMLKSNPDNLRMFGISEEILKEEAEKMEIFEKWSKMSAQEKREQDRALFREWLPKYRRRCSLEQVDIETRVSLMSANNPKYILRNYMLQNAISRAEKGDYSEVNTLLQLIKKPFDEQPQFENYTARPPPDASSICLTCSS